jgi:hypothetical protein
MAEPIVLANETAERRRGLALRPPVLDPSTAPPPDCARLLLPSGRHYEIAMPEGATALEILQGVPQELREHVVVYCHGTEVRDLAGFRTRAGDRLVLAVMPAGGKNGKSIVGAILTIVVAVFAPYVAGAFYAAGTVGYAVVTAAVTMVGAMVISALIKPPTINTAAAAGTGATTDGAQSYQLTGQSNAARPYGSCYVLYGRHKIMPALAATPDVDNWGNGTTISAIYDFGLGYVDVEDVRIGDVQVDQYQPQLVLHQNSLCRDLQLYSNRIGYDQFQVVQKQGDPFVMTTKPDSFAANLDIQFPGGIYQQGQNAALNYKADFYAAWRAAGAADWNVVPIDWYYGALGREYTELYNLSVQYLLQGVWPPPQSDWEDYNPATSPARMRQILSQSSVGMENDPYALSQPNPQFVFEYFGTNQIDDVDYWARNPDARARWPASRSARDHFESIGSREGRDPGSASRYVAVRITTPAGTVNYDALDPSIPTWLHQLDRTSGNWYIGGYLWIEQGRPGVPVPTHVQFSWRIKPGYAWDEATYLARYPDVANAVASGAVVSGWTHFQQYGGWEGRDPYAHLTQYVRLWANWVGPYWMRIAFQFPAPGTYELLVMRTDVPEDGTDTSIAVSTNGAIVRRVNQSVVGILRSYQWGNPVLPRQPHTMLEMRVRASEQLSGVVQNLSAIGISVLPVTNDGVNFWYQRTRNPAWIALDILTSEKNPKPISRAGIDWPSWLALASKCDMLRHWVANGQPFTAPRYVCDTVVADYVTVKDLVESVLSTCRSSLILTTAGLWGVLHDEDKSTPRQLITPANSWGFSGTRTFSQQPHALRVNFVNADNGWATDEVIVYADGYDANNATVYETLDTFGITDWPHGWAFGRYMLAQGILRGETFSVSMDVENLLVQRGDLVNVAHDVPRIGGVPTRIDTTYGLDPGGSGGYVVRANVDFSITPTGYTLRRNADDVIVSGRVLYWNAENRQMVLDANAAQAQPDDLLVLGTYDTVVQPYLVVSITPGQDLSADLALVKYDPRVYEADVGALPTWDAGLTPDYINTTDLAVTQLAARQRLYYENREPRIEVVLTWVTTGSYLAFHNITAITPSGQRIALAQEHKPQNVQWLVDALREASLVGVLLQFEVVPFSTSGLRGQAGYVTLTLEPDRTAPKPVASFGANVQKENIDLFWKAPDEPDVSHYLLRYTPEVDVPSWNASQQLAQMPFPATKTSAGARTGSYGIRVVDTSGNVSDVVWRRTTVERLPEINVIEVVNDRLLDPPWSGLTDHAQAVGIEVWSDGELGAIYPLGYYYMAELVDLGDVYEVRISSKIRAYGVTADDYMLAWQPLASVAAMASGTLTNDMWDAWLEVRTSNELAVIAEWQPLADVVWMSDGAKDSWSEWRPCVVGDFTARVVQMRIALESRNPGVRVVVSDGRVEVDMPDRIDSYPDVPIPIAGERILFVPAFRELRSTAISIDGNADPVTAETSAKDATGVTVRLRNTITGEYTSGRIDLMVEGFGRLRPESI